MSFETPLDVLAARLTSSAKIVDTFCSRSYPHPTDNGMSPGRVLPVDAPESVRRARQTLLEASQEIQQLVSEPSEYLEQHQVHYQQLASLQWLIHFKILAHIPLAHPVPYETVAVSANVPLARLKSVARMAMTGGLLTEPRPEHIAHSRISSEFIATPALLNWASFMTRYAAPTAGRFAEATERWGEGAEKHQTAYNVAFNTELPFFMHVSQDKEMAASFAEYMQSLAQSEGIALKHILNGFDWVALGKAHVVDVGGSTGQASTLLASHFPQLDFTVQDLPSTVAAAETIKQTLEPSVASRITFAAHDFFTPQPPSIAASADIYLLRRIIHDWSFAEAMAILNHLATALKPGALLLVMDTILPLPGSMHPTQEAVIRVRDLTMAQSFNSKEREMSDWEELFGSTMPKLRLRESTQPFGSVMALMTVVKDEES